MPTTVIFHVPHDGTLFDEELMKCVCVDRDAFLYYHQAMRDTGATCLIPPIARSVTVAFAYSRLLCDVERFLGEEEIMQKYGMGFCYERGFDGTKIKRVTPSVIEKTLQRYHAHHEKLNRIVKNTTEPIVLVDVHSFSSEIIVHRTLPTALPDVCIGYDDYLSEEEAMCVKKAFEENGFTVALNYPYSGSFTPNCIFNGEIKREFRSFMVEVNKACYLRGEEVNGAVAELIRSSVCKSLIALGVDA